MRFKHYYHSKYYLYICTKKIVRYLLFQPSLDLFRQWQRILASRSLWRRNPYHTIQVKGLGKPAVEKPETRLAKSLFLPQMVCKGIGQNCQNWWSKIVHEVIIIVHKGVKLVRGWTIWVHPQFFYRWSKP